MIGKLSKLAILLCLGASGVVAQVQPPQPPERPDRKVPVPVRTPRTPVAVPRPAPYPRDERFTTEKAIAVDPSVAIKLCVAEGSIKINGSESNEVRVLVRSGRKFDLKQLEENPDTKKPNWIWIANAAATGPGTRVNQSTCLAGDSVEIDVPNNAAINLEARTAGAVIDSVKKASVKIVEGSIQFRNVSGGVSAVVSQGDVFLQSVGGAISVETTTGNIVGFDVSAGQVGDVMKARTNSGSISLQAVNHRQIEATSISGSVTYQGKFMAGGIYTFKTQNGSVRILVPTGASATFVASYGFGNFNAAMPIDIQTQNVTPGGKSLVGVIGGGGPVVNVTTTSGNIGIRQEN